jgi:hypothetical protein
MNRQKLLEKVLSGSRNVRFSEFQSLVEAFGFQLVRVRGSHHIYSHPTIAEILNLQDSDGQAKPYQMRQFVQLIERYNLQMED